MNTINYTPKQVGEYQLPDSAYFTQGSEKYDKCAICLDEISPEKPGMIMKTCNHAFHPLCVKQAMQAHDACALCRSKIDKADQFPRIELYQTLKKVNGEPSNFRALNDFAVAAAEVGLEMLNLGESEQVPIVEPLLRAQHVYPKDIAILENIVAAWPEQVSTLSIVDPRDGEGEISCDKKTVLRMIVELNPKKSKNLELLSDELSDKEVIALTADMDMPGKNELISKRDLLLKAFANDFDNKNRSRILVKISSLTNPIEIVEIPDANHSDNEEDRCKDRIGLLRLAIMYDSNALNNLQIG